MMTFDERARCSKKSNEHFVNSQHSWYAHAPNGWGIMIQVLLLEIRKQEKFCNLGSFLRYPKILPPGVEEGTWAALAFDYNVTMQHIVESLGSTVRTFVRDEKGSGMVYQWTDKNGKKIGYLQNIDT